VGGQIVINTSLEEWNYYERNPLWYILTLAHWRQALAEAEGLESQILPPRLWNLGERGGTERFTGKETTIEGAPCKLEASQGGKSPWFSGNTLRGKGGKMTLIRNSKS